MKYYRICVFVCGIVMLSIGMLSQLGDHGLVSLEDSFLKKIMVSGNCEKCNDPEPSCPSKICFDSGWNCQEWDDYLFIEDNECESENGMVCVLDDLAACYQVYSYPKPTIGTCVSNGCSGAPTITTYSGWDDCYDGPA